MRDLISNIGLAFAIPPATYNADNTPPAVDLLGFSSAVIAIQVGVGGITFDGANKVQIKLTHSDDNTTYDAVTQDDVQGVAVESGGIVRSLVAEHAAATAVKVGYVGNRRYIKLLADFSGTHGAGTPISALVIKGNPANRPVV